MVPRLRHAEHRLQSGDAVEIVTLVGGGSAPPADKPLHIGKFTFKSWLITGTGKYKFGATGAYFKWPVKSGTLGTRISRCLHAGSGKIERCR